MDLSRVQRKPFEGVIPMTDGKWKMTNGEWETPLVSMRAIFVIFHLSFAIGLPHPSLNTE